MTDSASVPSSASYQATPEALARILLLIDGFSQRGNTPSSLEGRVKLAKLDFLLRYPRHLNRVLERRSLSARARAELTDLTWDEGPFDSRMMRYRYGPWDPSYYAVLGSLVGRGLVESIPMPGTGFAYRTTQLGKSMAEYLRADPSFELVARRVALLQQHLDLTGSRLKDLLYELPEVADARWKDPVDD